MHYKEIFKTREASYRQLRQRRVIFLEERREKTAATFDNCLLVMLRELSKRKLLISLTVKRLNMLRHVEKAFIFLSFENCTAKDRLQF